MSGLQNFLAPFSHLLFWNRNLDIVVLCFVLFFVACIALQKHWQASKMERELANARQNASMSPAGRRYSTAPPVPEPAPQEMGGPLPPVKGGRTYARNLGSALQKAGMSQPIYSPPTPAGWSPQPGAGHAGQPGTAPPYAAPNVPWAATPPTAPPVPWAVPGGGGRNLPGPAPSSAPFYQPPQPMAPISPTVGQPPVGPAPQVYAPPSPGPFVPPSFMPPTSGPGAAAPAMTPPGAPPMMPPVPPMPVPAVEPTDGDAARRGKPKRRRFNFNVLENLEKMVQPKPAEPAPTTGWTPPAAPPTLAGPPAPTPAQATFAAIPPSPPLAAPSTPQPAAPTPPVPPVVPETPAITPKPVDETPVPSFLFGKRSETPTVSQPAEPVSEPVLDFSAPALEEKPGTADEHAAEPAAATDEPAVTESEAPAEADSKPDPRRSMRSMMFGEEASAPAPAESLTPEPEVSEPVAEVEATSEAPTEPAGDDSGSVWPSYPWARREASSSVDDEATAGEAASTESAPAEEVHREEPATEPAAAEAYEPWTPSVVEEPATWESEPVAEEHGAAAADEAQPVAQTAHEEAGAEAPSEPVAAADEKGGAGTIVIIEDDQTAASYYSTLFRGNGYRVEVANDGVSGVDLCARVQPQVILLDVMMPRQNGILVLQTLRASDETKNTPVVVMSNFSEPTLIKRAIQLGALEYVIKTQVEGPALLNALPRWMNREKAFAAA